MTKIQVFDPPMCCSSGVCGPKVDPNLVRFAADLQWLASEGVSVERFNLAQQPQAFAENAEVRQLLDSEGTGGLPLILVNGIVVSRACYPERKELAGLTGVTYVAPAPQLVTLGTSGK